MDAERRVTSSIRTTQIDLPWCSRFEMLVSNIILMCLVIDAVTLPAAPSSLRPSSKIAPPQQSPLSEFQEELVWLSASIQGDQQVPEVTNVEDAWTYIQDAVSKFFEAATAGLSPNHILQAKSATSSEGEIQTG